MKLLGGWGNFPRQLCRVARPATAKSIPALLTREPGASWIARGLGRSYGDSSLNVCGTVLLTTDWDRLCHFDEATGVLECEAGVSLAAVIGVFLPRGWFLPTTPGTKFVTIGGAVAADVHGKNHHRDGSFGNFVLSLRLATATGEVVTCSREENTQLFFATLGGMGLTGVILSARLRLVRTPSCYVQVDFQATRSLAETLDRITETEANYRYSVAWVDATAQGERLGRSILMLANDASVADLPQPLQSAAHTLPARRQLSVPFELPAMLLNSWSVALFNWAIYSGHRRGRHIVDYESFFYPLDRIHHWNRMYGRRGFIQYQALFSRDVSRRGLNEILGEISGSGQTSFLAVLKSSGQANPGLLSYLYPGHTLAIDLRNTGEALAALTRRLDEIVLNYGGRVYLAKDALMTAEGFRAMYPRLDEFLAIKSAVDPHQRFRSAQSDRLGITATP